MTEIDWAVVIGYSAGLTLCGVFLARRRARSVDFFLASRSMGWVTIGLALFASNMSSTALVGLAGAAYAYGISAYNYEWSAVVLLIILCARLLPAMIRSGIYTLPQFLEQRYDRRVRLLFSLLSLFLNVFVDTAGVLYSGAIVCQLLFPAFQFWAYVAVLAGLAAMYATLGGLRSVIYTEAVQGIVLIGASTLVAYSAFTHAGGWFHVMRTVNPASLSLIRPAGDPSVPWPGLVFGIPLLGFYYWCTNQSTVQRLLAARDVEQARLGALLLGFLKLPVLFLMVLPGICALLLFPNLSRADLVYPRLMLSMLPPGLTGLVVAAFIASTVVAVASKFNSASTLLTMDIVKQLRPDLSDTHTVRAGRIATLAVFAVAVIFTPQLIRSVSLWQYLQGALAYTVPPLVAVFLLGLFWTRASATGAVVALAGGSVLGLMAFLGNTVFGITHIHFLYVAPVLTLLDGAMLVAVSARVTSGRVLSAPYAFTTRAEVAAGRPWRDYRILSALLLLLTAAIVIAFR